MTRGSRPAATLIAAALLAALAPLAQAADDAGGRPLGSVRINDRKTFPRLPADAPQAVWYGFPPGQGHGTGCGLLPPGAQVIDPLVEPGEDGEWPSCMGVPDATSFDWKGRPVFVYRYLQRDTREDTYTYDAFVRVGKDGLEGVEGLDDEPTGLSIAKAAAWAKSTLAASDAAADGFQASKRDTVLAERGYLLVARNAAAGSCRVVAGRLAAGGAPPPLTLPCKAILATTALSTPRSDWLLALVQGPDGKPQGRVFEAGATGVREATDTEAKLAPAVASGRILAVKAALKQLLER